MDGWASVSELRLVSFSDCSSYKVSAQIGSIWQQLRQKKVIFLPIITNRRICLCHSRSDDTLTNQWPAVMSHFYNLDPQMSTHQKWKSQKKMFRWKRKTSGMDDLRCVYITVTFHDWFDFTGRIIPCWLLNSSACSTFLKITSSLQNYQSPSIFFFLCFTMGAQRQTLNSVPHGNGSWKECSQLISQTFDWTKDL